MQDVSPSSITYRDQKEREKKHLSEERQRPEEAETGNNVEKVKGKKMIDLPSPDFISPRR